MSLQAGEPAASAGTATGDSAWLLLGGLAAGLLAFAATLLVFEVDAKYTFAAFVTLLLIVLLSFSGQLRPICLILVFLFAPLGLRISFHPILHMGGAGAIFIDLVDPFLLLLLFFQWRDIRRQPGRRWRFPPATAFWACMIILGVGTVVIGPLRSTAANEVVRMAKLLLLAVVLVNEVVRRRQFQQITVAIALMMILQSTIALTQYTMGRQLGLKFLGEASDADIEALSAATLLTGDFVYRPDGLLGHSNLLAGYLAMNLPIAVALLLAPVSRRLKALLVLVLLVGQPALVLTLSRAGWIEYSVAFLLVLGLGALHPSSRRLYLHARAAVLGLALVVVLALTPVIVQRLSDTDPTAVEYRLEWLHTAAKMIVDHPVLGVGLNGYTYLQVPYGRDKTPEAMADRYGVLWPAVHNSWVLTWAEQGTLGFLLWVAVHVSVLRVGVQNLRIRDPMMHALGAGLLAGFIAIMIDGLASFFVRTEAPGRLFWIAAALILAIGYWRREQAQPDAATAQGGDAALPAAGLPVTRKGSRWLPARESPLR